VARLVEKKGLERQLALYSAARDAGLDFSVRIYGDGPLRRTLERQIAGTGLGDRVVLLGHRPFAEIQEALAWADGLVHTGVVTASGDRDGLPNVIPEAMAAGVIVTTTPTAATTEAIAHAQTGLVVELADTAGWVAAWRRLATDDAGGERWRAGARAWVEENFDVHRNVAVLLSRIRKET
jgi:glycosyltransferase involved in cell wall biosynthesis